MYNSIVKKMLIIYTNNKDREMVKVIYPSIDKLLNIVDSKYKLVHIAADRAKVMKEHKHFQMNEDEYVSKKEIGRALEEIDKGLITIKSN